MAGGVALACGCKPVTVGLMSGKLASSALLLNVSVTFGAAEGSRGGVANGAPPSDGALAEAQHPSKAEAGSS